MDIRCGLGAIALVVCLGQGGPSTAANSNAQIEDLEFARKNYVMKSMAFSPESRREAVAFIDRLQKQVGTMSKEKFLISFLEIAAFSHNAHDSLRFASDKAWRPESKLPFRIIWFPDAMVIARVAPEFKELLGAKVERIEELSVNDLPARLRKLSGGPDRYVLWNTVWIIENAGLLHAFGVARAPDKLRLNLLLRDGRRVEREIAFVPQSTLPPRLGPVRLWSGELTAAEQEYHWSAAIRVADQPFYLRRGDDFFRMERMPEIDGVYVQFRANSTADAEGHEIGPFVRQVRTEVEKSRPKNLVLDLRFDIGGNIDETRDLIRTLTANVRERIYVITSRYTFSAGIVMAAAMRHDGGQRVMIVGEKVGDELRWWSEGENACVPNSKYCLRATNGLWDLIHGCAKERGCYGDRLDARVKSLEPQLPAALTAESWLNGKDPAMDAIKTDLNSATQL